MKNSLEKPSHFEGSEGRVSGVKYCIDCSHSTIHQTGSTLWTSCEFQDGWRSIDATCNLPQKGIDNAIQGLYPIKGATESFCPLKTKSKLAIFREQNKEVNLK